MTGAEFAALIKRTGWSGRSVAERFGLSHGVVGDMQTGRRPVNDELARYLERVAAAIERIRPPELVDRRRRD
jgi:transcriptional regulator with XRE-family HTH domain